MTSEESDILVISIAIVAAFSNGLLFFDLLNTLSLCTSLSHKLKDEDC